MFKFVNSFYGKILNTQKKYSIGMEVLHNNKRHLCFSKIKKEYSI